MRLPMSAVRLREKKQSNALEKHVRSWAAVAIAAFVGLVGAWPASADEVIVYAASSLTNAMSDVGHAYEAESPHEVRFSFASSSILARQITHGAPAEIYLSANIQWMDYVHKHGEILKDTRKRLVANQLALVAPTGSEIDDVAIRPGFPLAELLAGGMLAIANPTHVPAGIYGKQALQSLGVWQSVDDRLVRGSNVRVTLNYVAHGGIPLGIVYATDAAVADDVKIVGIFPVDSHPPIVYTAALTETVGPGDDGARDFFKFMDSTVADRILASYGFKVLD